MRRILAPAGLVVGSVLATLLLLEVAVRIVGVSLGTGQISRHMITRSSNPQLLYALRPNVSVRAKVDYRTNSHGMRNRELPQSKPPGTIRIAVIGDSIAFGWWVEEANLFPSRLEGMLNAAGPPRVEVLNFGVPGYNLEQETEALRSQVLGFSPDVVIFAFCLNDLRTLSNQFGRVLFRASQQATLPGRLSESLLEHSMLLSWTEYRMALLKIPSRPGRRSATSARGGYAQELGGQRGELSQGFSGIAQVLQRASIPGLLAVFPLLQVRFEEYPYRDVHDEVIETARGAGLWAVDLLPRFAAHDFRAVRVDDVHPSPLGHRVAAHALLDALCAFDLLRGTGLSAGASGVCEAQAGPRVLTVGGH
jgi:lysophospholipase L1-like esterase